MNPEWVRLFIEERCVPPENGDTVSVTAFLRRLERWSGVIFDEVTLRRDLRTRRLLARGRIPVKFRY